MSSGSSKSAEAEGTDQQPVTGMSPQQMKQFCEDIKDLQKQQFSLVKAMYKAYSDEKKLFDAGKRKPEMKEAETQTEQGDFRLDSLPSSSISTTTNSSRSGTDVSKEDFDRLLGEFKELKQFVRTTQSAGSVNIFKPTSSANLDCSFLNEAPSPAQVPAVVARNHTKLPKAAPIVSPRISKQNVPVPSSTKKRTASDSDELESDSEASGISEKTKRSVGRKRTTSKMEATVSQPEAPITSAAGIKKRAVAVTEDIQPVITFDQSRRSVSRPRRSLSKARASRKSQPRGKSVSRTGSEKLVTFAAGPETPKTPLKSALRQSLKPVRYRDDL